MLTVTIQQNDPPAVRNLDVTNAVTDTGEFTPIFQRVLTWELGKGNVVIIDPGDRGGE